MSLFKKGKDEIIDLRPLKKSSPKNILNSKSSFSSSTNGFDSDYSRSVQNPVSSSPPQNSSTEMFGIFGGADASTSMTVNPTNLNSNYSDFSNSTVSNNSLGEVDDKIKKFSRSILDMTNSIEEISNKIYILQQRLEILERSADAGGINGK